MGRERTTASKYVYFCAAYLIFLSLFSCAGMKQVFLRKEAQGHLSGGEKLLAQKNYDAALNEFQKVLSLRSPKPLEEEALFNMGLIYAHFGNPKRDYGKSLEYFKRLIKNYPKSPFVEQAKIWVGILEENEELNYLIQKLKQVDIDIEQMKRNRPQ